MRKRCVLLMGKKRRRADGYGAYYWWVSGEDVQFSRLLKSLHEVLLLKRTAHPGHHDNLFQFVDLFNNLWIFRCFKIFDKYFFYSKVFINTYRLWCSSCRFIISCFLYWDIIHIMSRFCFIIFKKSSKKLLKKSFKITKQGCLRQLNAAY